MVGYGPEDDHFVLELTYNYNVGNYKLGDDFVGVWLNSKSAVKRIMDQGISYETDEPCIVVKDPDGHPFYIHNFDSEGSKDFWTKACGMKLLNHQVNVALFSFGQNQIVWELRGQSKAVDRGTGFGRIAFACTGGELPSVEKTMQDRGAKILNPLITLDTPGKASVQVVIVADPDDHEICFVGDEGFRELSKLDPGADMALKQAIENDKSADWFSKIGQSKLTA